MHKKKHRYLTEDRGFAIRQMNNLSEKDFKIMFRMSRASFEILLEKVTPLIQVQENFAILSSGSLISNTTKLAVTLRWLAGGIYLDLCFAWAISKSGFYQCELWPTIQALDKVLKIGFPTEEEALNSLAASFSKHSNGILNGCVMAIDGLLIRTRKPTAKEVRIPMAYRNRKGCFGILVMAGCDIDGRFLMSVVNNSGGTHDVLAFETSEFYNYLVNGGLADKFFIIGDEAFNCTNQVLTPWPGRGLGRWEDSFNYWLSHSRQCIERAFGMLVARWGVLWRKFEFSYSKWSLVTTVLMKLHNFCIDRNEIEIPKRFHEDILPDDRGEVHLGGGGIDENGNLTEPPVRIRAQGSRRSSITTTLELEGTGRPPHAQINSRAR